jgi:hypothetical protein
VAIAGWWAALQRRRSDQQRWVGITDLLADVERRTDEVNRRTARAAGREP